MTTPSASTNHAAPAALSPLLAAVATAAKASGVFGEVTTHPLRVDCAAPASAAPAFYRITFEDGTLFTSLVTSDRYLSQSIEQDLVHTGDKLEELLEEELVELNYNTPINRATTKMQHFRSEDKLFTFRIALPFSTESFASPASHKIATQFLMGMEATFRRLGGMEESGDE